jgi:hypothetical protein
VLRRRLLPGDVGIRRYPTHPPGAAFATRCLRLSSGGLAMNAPANLLDLLAHAAPTSLDMEEVAWQRVDPRWSMVARVFVNRLQNEAVLPRLERAGDADDLKAALLVDYYLSLTRSPQHRQHVRELLASDATLADVATYAALSFAQELLWPDDADAPLDKSQLFYLIPEAAAQLGRLPEQLYADILADRVAAQLVISRAELERLLALQAPDGGGHGSPS